MSLPATTSIFFLRPAAGDMTTKGMYEIISKKRDGLELDREDIAYVISGYVRGDIPDYQVAAWLMAVYLRGLSERELADILDPWEDPTCHGPHLLPAEPAEDFPTRPSGC